MSASVKAKADRAEARARGEKPEYEFKSPTDDTAKPGGESVWSVVGRLHSPNLRQTALQGKTR